MRTLSTINETDKGKRLLRAAQLYQTAEEGIANELWDVAVTELESIEELCSDMWEEDGRIGESLDRGQVLSLLGFARQCLGNLDEAAAIYEEGLSLYRKRGKSDEDSWFRMGESMTNYAEVLAYQGDAEKAAEVAAEAFSIVREAHGEESELTAGVQANLGAYLCTLEKFKEARPHLEAALATFERVLGRDNGYTAGTLRNVYKMLESLGLEDECAKLREDWADQANELDFSDDPSRFAGMEPSDGVVKDAFDDWAEPRKAFDPEGFLKKTGASREQIEQFIAMWEKDGAKVPPELLSFMKRDVDLMGTGRSGLDHGDVLARLIDDGADVSAMTDLLGEDASALGSLSPADDLGTLLNAGKLPKGLAEQVRQVQDEAGEFESSLGISVTKGDDGHYRFENIFGDEDNDDINQYDQDEDEDQHNGSANKH